MSRLASGLILLCLVVAPAATPGVPHQLSDKTFWQMIADLSEPEGSSAGGDNFVSNETLFQDVFPALKQNTRSGAVYLGVGPEQNFSYIAAVRPGMAFILDIRRQNLLEHLMYKMVFEASADRAAFLSHLFSRPRPPGIGSETGVEALFKAYDGDSSDESLFQENLKMVVDGLDRHGFHLDAGDVAKMEYLYRPFFARGTRLSYLVRPVPKAQADFPDYRELMLQTDGKGRNWSFLATEANFRIVKDLEARNLVIPVVGDFAGPKALRGIGQYVRGHGSSVTAIYASNVEEYLFASPDNWKKYYSNLSALPVRPPDLFVRSVSVTDAGRGLPGPGLRAVMMSERISDLLRSVTAGTVAKYDDVVRQSRCGQPDFAKYGCRP